MSLVQGYSSDEDDVQMAQGDDTFGLSAIPTSKKARVENQVVSMVETSAPDVLSEVCTLLHSLLNTVDRLNHE